MSLGRAVGIPVGDFAFLLAISERFLNTSQIIPAIM
jgi:hypothetical protein